MNKTHILRSFGGQPEQIARIAHAALLLSVPAPENGYWELTWDEDARSVEVPEKILSELRLYDEDIYWSVLAEGFKYLQTVSRPYSLSFLTAELEFHIDHNGLSESSLKDYFEGDLAAAHAELMRSPDVQSYRQFHDYLREAISFPNRTPAAKAVSRYCDAYFSQLREDAAILCRAAVSQLLSDCHGEEEDRAKCVDYAVFSLDCFDGQTLGSPGIQYWASVSALPFRVNDLDDHEIFYDFDDLDFSEVCPLLFGSEEYATDAFIRVLDLLDSLNPSMQYRRTLGHYFFVRKTPGEDAYILTDSLRTFLPFPLARIANFETRTVSCPAEPDMDAFNQRFESLRWSLGVDAWGRI